MPIASLRLGILLLETINILNPHAGNMNPTGTRTIDTILHFELA